MSKKFTLLGRKLDHSLSPEIHSFFGDYEYTLSPTEPGCLDSFFSNTEFSGFNVTIPYKVDAFNACDILSEEAKQIGSVNTCIRLPDGRLSGYNTDYYGFGYMCSQAGIDFRNKKVMILGSGGSSLTVRTYAKNHGAAKITVISRSGPDNYTNISGFSDSNIIINTTPVGMYPDTGVSPIDFDGFNSCQFAIDHVYNPERTAFIQSAQEHGIKTAGGLRMLIAQGAESKRIFTGEDVDDALLEKVYKSVSLSHRNICLIGMPGSGKTTAGKILAGRLGRHFVDTDEEIEKAGLTIPGIFSRYGEQYFRDLEENVIRKTCMNHGLVISTGGGAVLSPKNRLSIRENSVVVYLMRDIRELATGGRPLSQSTADNKALFEERHALYESTKDIAVQVSDDPEETAERIITCISSL